MPYNPDQHHRRSIRLRGYDYTQAGAYFVTIVTQQRLCLFGDIVDGAMHLNAAGRMVQTIWNDIPAHYPGVDIDVFIVMPNHIHGIIVLTGDPPNGPPRGVAPTASHGDASDPGGDSHPPDWPVGAGPRACPPGGNATILSLPDVVHRYKTLTTKLYTDGVKCQGWIPYSKRVWQRNYYEHIIRDEASLQCIRDYIATNPDRWDEDNENPARSGIRSDRNR